MAKLEWAKTKISSWVLYREFTARPKKSLPILGEMRVIERLAASRLGLSGDLNKDHQSVIEAEALRLVNGAVDNFPNDVNCMQALRELLEFAEQEIHAQQISFNDKLLSAEGEIELLFKFIHEIKAENIPEVVATTPARLDLFNSLLELALKRSSQLGIVVHKSVSDYNLAHNDQLVAVVSNPLLYTPGYAAASASASKGSQVDEVIEQFSDAFNELKSSKVGREVRSFFKKF